MALSYPVWTQKEQAPRLDMQLQGKKLNGSNGRCALGFGVGKIE